MPTRQAERPYGLSALLFQDSGRELEAKVRSESKCTLSSYNETHKGTDLEPLDS